MPKDSRDDFIGVSNTEFETTQFRFGSKFTQIKLKKKMFSYLVNFSNLPNQTTYFEKYCNFNYKDFQIHQKQTLP